jgi:hypothetical protein
VPALVRQDDDYCCAAGAADGRILHQTRCEQFLQVLDQTKPRRLLDQWHKTTAAVDISHRYDIVVVEHLVAVVVVAEEVDHSNIDDEDNEKEAEVRIPVVVAHRVVVVVDRGDIVLMMMKDGDCYQMLHTGRERVD